MFPRPILHFVRPRTQPTPDPYILPPPSDILVHMLPSQSTPACALAALLKAHGWLRAPRPLCTPATPLPTQGSCCTGDDPALQHARRSTWCLLPAYMPAQLQSRREPNQGMHRQSDVHPLSVTSQCQVASPRAGDHAAAA